MIDLQTATLEQKVMLQKQRLCNLHTQLGSQATVS